MMIIPELQTSIYYYDHNLLLTTLIEYINHNINHLEYWVKTKPVTHLGDATFCQTQETTDLPDTSGQISHPI